MTKIKPYYPTHYLGCNPIHEVKNWAYVRRLIRAARAGEEINPILIEGSIGGGSLLAGTHRAAANDILVMLGEEPLIDVVSTDDVDMGEELAEAIAESDYGRIDDLWDRK